MACGCRRSKKEAAVTQRAAVAAPKHVAGNRAGSMIKLVNYEGKMIAFNTLPRGSIYVRGVWYSSVEKMPEDVRDEYKQKLKG